jgi:hypothetical protein
VAAGEAVVATDVGDVLPRSEPRRRQGTERHDGYDGVQALVRTACAREGEHGGGAGGECCELEFHPFLHVGVAR